MGKKFYLLATTLSVFLFGCTNHAIRGSWELQEVQIPLTEDFNSNINYDYYQSISITDRSFEVWNSEPRLVERWSYSINNDSLLTLSSGFMYKNFVIKEVSKKRLVLADEQTLSGYTLYIFVPYGEKNGSVKYTKHCY